MSRYVQAEIGVWDAQESAFVLPRTEAWKAYTQWLAAGNSPDPQPPPSAPETLQRRRQQHRDRVLRAADENATLGVSVGGNRYRLDADDRATLIGVLASVTSGNALPAGFGWRDKTGTFQSLTLANLKNLIEKMTQRDIDRRKNLWALLDAIEAASEPEVIDPTAGWPT